MNSFRVSVSVAGIAKRQRTVKHHSLDAGRIQVEGPDFTEEVKAQAIKQAQEALKSMKDTQPSCMVVLNYFKSDGTFEEWEVFGKDNRRMRFELVGGQLIESTLKMVA